MKESSVQPRFAIITPTIKGRERMLMTALASSWSQDFTDFVHVVLADGDTNAEEVCKSAVGMGMNVKFVPCPGTPQGNDFGTRSRNLGMQTADADYYVFLDDDNVLFRNYLVAFDELARFRGDPPLLAQRCHYVKRWEMQRHQDRNGHAWIIVPPRKPETLQEYLKVTHTEFDTLNICVRKDVAKQVKFVNDYNHDFIFANECVRVGGASPVMVDNIGAVHL